VRGGSRKPAKQPAAGKGGRADRAADAGGGSDSPSADDTRAVVRVVASRHPEAADEAEAAIVGAGPGPIFQRGGQLVHIATRPVRRSDGTSDAQEVIITADYAVLAGQLARHCRFERYDIRAKNWLPTDPPKRVFEDLIARGRWNLPDLRLIIATPTLRSDGSLLDRQGYDEKTGLYLSRELPGLSVPERPTRLDADRAVDILVDLFRDFPFAARGEQGSAEISLSVAVAGLLTALTRHALPHAPLFSISAPTAGSGKSYLVDVISVIATGQTAVTIGSGRNVEEFEKGLGAALLEGQPLVSIDNISAPLGGDLLCRVLSQERTAVRLLGRSKIVEVPTSVTLFATGNNMTVHGDMARRTLVCHLDSGMENPEERQFESDLIDEASRRRPDLVSAGLTILRWRHIAAREPGRPTGRTLAGFGPWCELVAGALLALDHADPVAAVDIAKTTDDKRQKQLQLAKAWQAAFGEDRETAADAIRWVEAGPAESMKHQDLRDAMSAVARARGGGLDATRLGNYLGNIQDNPLDGYRFRKDGLRRGVVLWWLEKV